MCIYAEIKIKKKHKHIMMMSSPRLWSVILSSEHTTEVGGQRKSLLIKFHSTPLLTSNKENPASSPVPLLRRACQDLLSAPLLASRLCVQQTERPDSALHRGETGGVSEELQLTAFTAQTHHETELRQSHLALGKHKS